MKASRAAARQVRSLDELQAQMAEVLEALERIEAKVDAVMFPEEGGETPPPQAAAKGK